MATLHLDDKGVRVSRHRNIKGFNGKRRTLLYSVLLPCLFMDTAAASVSPDAPAGIPAGTPATVQFREELLRVPVDVSMFAAGNPIPPGNYRVDLHMNGQWKGRTDVHFEIPPEGGQVAQPCFDSALLESLGFDLAHATPELQSAIEKGTQICRPLGELLEGANARYDHTEFRLDVASPQTLLQREARGYVDPSLWDNGITAGILQYDYNAYRTEYSGKESWCMASALSR